MRHGTQPLGAARDPFQIACMLPRIVLATLGMTLAPLVAQDRREVLSGWNASFAVPSGWRVLQVEGRAAALTDSLESGAVFVTAGYMTTAAEAQSELLAMFVDLHYSATATSAPKDTTIGTRPAMIATYSGAGRAGTIVTKAAVVFSNFGTGVMVIGLAKPDRFGRVSETVSQIAASIQVSLPATNVAAVSGLAGHWDYVPPAAAAHDSTAAGKVSIDEWLEFDGHERFTWHSRTIVSVRGAAPLTAENRDDAGTYTVVGTTLVLRGKRARAIDIHLEAGNLSLGGRAYRRKRG